MDPESPRDLVGRPIQRNVSTNYVRLWVTYGTSLRYSPSTRYPDSIRD
jgi:hypothetical protein